MLQERRTDMDAYEILPSIGNAAVALAGFSGVVAALRHRGHGEWSADELLQLRTLVEPSLVALFGSFLPGLLRLGLASDPLVWRLSNGVLALVGVAALGAFVARSRFADTTRGQRILVFLVPLAIGTQLLAAGGALPQVELVFVAALVLGLVVAAYNFLLLLFGLGRHGE